MKIFRSLFFCLFFLFVAVLCYGQSGGVKYRKYVVRKKASIQTVAFLNDVTPEQILMANPTLNPKANLKAGTEVNIPVFPGNDSGDDNDGTSSVTAGDKDLPKGIKEDKGSNNMGNIPSEKKTQVSSEKQAAKVVTTGVVGAQVTQNVVAEDRETEKSSVGSGNDSSSLIDFNVTRRKITFAVLLPFENPSLSESMVELYSGMVIAASDIADGGETEVELKVYSTENLSSDYLDGILSQADVIVGPVHQQQFVQVASWAKKHHKPIVSPLASFDVDNNNYVVSMPPVQSCKSDPLTDYFSGDKNIVLIEHASYPNKQLEGEFQKIAPNARKFRYVRESVTPQDLATLMDKEKENIVLVPTDHQGAIEDVLSKITAINSPIKNFNISIVGSSAWMNLSNFSQTLLFRGNVSCVSSYYFDREDKIVGTLFDDYINAFERIPTRFAMRGYDIVDIMANSLQKWGSSTLVEMDGVEFTPLQTPYHFAKNEANGNVQNVRWIMVCYGEDYSIKVR